MTRLLPINGAKEMPRKDPIFTRKALGHFSGREKRPKIAVLWEPVHVAAINARAERNNRSFAAEVRALMEWALTTAPKPKTQ